MFRPKSVGFLRRNLKNSTILCSLCLKHIYMIFFQEAILIIGITFTLFTWVFECHNQLPLLIKYIYLYKKPANNSFPKKIWWRIEELLLTWKERKRNKIIYLNWIHNSYLIMEKEISLNEIYTNIAIFSDCLLIMF